MTRNYDVVEGSSTTLAEIMSAFHSAKENVSFQLNQWIVAELSRYVLLSGANKDYYYLLLLLSSDTPCAGLQ